MTDTQNLPAEPMAGTLSVDTLVAQVKQIQLCMAELMKEDEHYGVIPGTKKPTLYKAGAEKLGMMFRLAPSYKIERRQLDGDHVEYIVTCELHHIQTKEFWGEGVGAASTKESKHRYRNEKDFTGVPVPKKYWTLRNNEQHHEAQELLGGKGFAAAKHPDTGQWQIAELQQGENKDIADTWNTVLKMSKKRAMVDAMISATAASDIFTQDLEDIKSNEKSAAKTEEPKEKQQPKPDANEQQQQPGGRPLSKAELQVLDAMPDDLVEYFTSNNWTRGQAISKYQEHRGDYNTMRGEFGLPTPEESTDSGAPTADTAAAGSELFDADAEAGVENLGQQGGDSA